MADPKKGWFGNGQTAAQGGAKAPTYSTPKPTFQEKQVTNAGWNFVKNAPRPSTTTKR